MKIKAVVFDIDGVLLDTEGMSWDAWNEALKEYGIVIGKEEYVTCFVGRALNDIEDYLIRKYGIEVVNGVLSSSKENILLGWFREKPIVIFPHVKKTLDFLKGKVKLAAASNSPGEEVRLKLERTGLLGYFDFFLSRDDVSHGKPSPEIYSLAAKRFGFKPGECMVFEDTLSGVKSAKDAGLVCIGVLNGFSQMQDLIMADAVLQGFESAEEFLKNYF